METFGCVHYPRGCAIRAPCCKLFYTCRLCHDEHYKGPKGPGCLVQLMQFREVEEVKCLKCEQEQTKSNECRKCSFKFGEYFCQKCALYDNTPNKDIFHCDLCRMCRRGTRQNNQHCSKCNLCISKIHFKGHKCMDLTGVSCAVCLQLLFTSIKFYFQIDRCGHWIHTECYNHYVKSINGLNCPVCGMASVNMDKRTIEEIDKLLEDNKQRMPEDLRERRSNILCLECGEKHQVKFNFYLKCLKCGSYNTKEI